MLSVLLLTVTSCTGGSAPTTTTTTPTLATTSTTSVPTPTTSTLPTTTTTQSQALLFPWEDFAERQVENLLAALTAGEYEAAGWVGESVGATFINLRPDETLAQYYERLCGGSRCAGPYSIVASEIVDVPGPEDVEVVDVTVRHDVRGEESVFRLHWHEGLPVVVGLPPLVESFGRPPLVETLFGEDVPDFVVIERYHAYEVWDGGTGVWAQIPPVPLVGWEEPVDLTDGDDGEWAARYERGGMVITIHGDAEGNLQEATNPAGVSLIGDDYPGYTRISTDGDRLVYTDHRDGESHFVSRVLVVRDTDDGREVGRWVFDGFISCIEASGDWVLICLETEEEGLVLGEYVHDSLVAINLADETVNRVESRAQVYLPDPR